MATGAEIVGAALYAAVSLFAAVLAALVLMPTPRRALNWLLAGALALLSLNIGSFLAFRYGPIFSELITFNIMFYGQQAYVVFTGVYVAFVARALRTPLATPMRSGPGTVALVLVVGALVAWGYADPAKVATVGPSDLQTVLAAFYVAAFVWSLAAAFDAWRRTARGSLQRRRAEAYLLAFAIFDAGNLVVVGALLLGVPEAVFRFLIDYFLNAVQLASMAFLARALLREQLFDFDLKLKVNLQRGTVAAIFLAVFVVVAQVAQNLLEGAFGWLAGGAAAGVLVFALAPIQRAAERVARAAMPATQDTPEYRLVKKREVYLAALDGALADGTISEKERAALARIADQLGLTVSETVALEREAKAGAAAIA